MNPLRNVPTWLDEWCPPALALPVLIFVVFGMAVHFMVALLLWSFLPPVVHERWFPGRPWSKKSEKRNPLDTWP